jgi:hypothetical protein
MLIDWNKLINAQCSLLIVEVSTSCPYGEILRGSFSSFICGLTLKKMGNIPTSIPIGE